MLVLSRRVGQQIRIGKSVVVTLLKVERNKARIGVEAPPGIPVFRQELLDFDRSRRAAPPIAPLPLDRSPVRDLRSSRPIIRGFNSPRSLWDNVSL